MLDLIRAQIQEEAANLQQFTQEKLGPEGEWVRRNMELTRPIFEQVNAALKTIAESDGFDFIFDVAAGGTIVFARPDSLSLTDRLMEELARTRVAEAKDGG